MGVSECIEMMLRKRVNLYLGDVINSKTIFLVVVKAI